MQEVKKVTESLPREINVVEGFVIYSVVEKCLEERP